MTNATPPATALSRRQVIAGAAVGALAVSPTASALAAGRRPDPLASLARSTKATDPADLGVLEAAALLRGRKLSAVELLAACQARITARNGGAPTFDGAPDAVNAWIRLYPQIAAQHAKDADRRLKREGRDAPIVCGVPIGLKDLYSVAGQPVTASSHVLDGNVAHEDSIVWARLKAAGMVLVGHTHTHEFAAGTTTDQVGNPWDVKRSAGGSSGGSGAALAARMIPAATGTDTGGSLRIPAALCGISSIKGTHGRLPIDGILPLAATLDHAGPMARTVADAAAIYDVLAHGGGQVTAQMPPTGPLGALATAAARGAKPLAGLTVAVTDRPTGLDADVDSGLTAARRALTRLGARVVSRRAPAPFDMDLAYAIMLTDVWSYHRQFAGKESAYRPAIRDLIGSASAMKLPAVDYIAAQQARDAHTATWRRWFASEGVDLVLEPTVPTVAPERGHGYDSGSHEGETLSALCLKWDVTGFPVVALPAGLGKKTGLPVGVSLIAPSGGEALAVRAAVELQSKALAPPVLKA